MSTQSPKPFPTSGQRQLSKAEQMQRMKALECTLPKDNRPSCSGQVFVGIFFDGTGNNMRDDYERLPPEKRKHSNVVKLFQTYPFRKPGHFRYYIPGVGTPFPEIGDSGKGFWRTAGAAAGWKGEERLIWAFTRLINAPHQFVYTAPLIPDSLGKSIFSSISRQRFDSGFSRRSRFGAWQDQLKAALHGKKPRVEQINLSVFGFSRGAAEARVFVNWLFETCKQERGGWTFAGIPIRLQFLGIFDTVASVGAANLYDNGILAGHQDWGDDTLEIHPAVEQCVHFVAGHEVRACFPLDSVRVKKHYPANAREVMYPGAHSDVGGGYAPNALGVSPAQNAFLSIIPGVNMYHEARQAGVPLTAWNDLDETTQRYLKPAPEVINDFNAYLKAARIGAGPVEAMGRKHMGLYFSYRYKYLHQAAFRARPPYTRASQKDSSNLYKTQRALFQNLWTLKQTLTRQDPKLGQKWLFLKKYGHVLEKASNSWTELRAVPSIWKQAWDLSSVGKLVRNAEPALVSLGKSPMAHAYEVAQSIRLEAVTPAIETFFERYVHDSVAGFINDLDEYQRNGIGLVKFRTVFKGND